MSYYIDYSKEFEKIVLTGDVTDALKNIVPKSIQDYYIRFLSEIKKTYTTQTMTKELQKIFKEIKESQFHSDFISECEKRYNLAEFELKTTSKERKKEIIDYLNYAFCGVNFDASKPDFASKFDSTTENKQNIEEYPCVLTEEMIKKETKKFYATRIKSLTSRLTYSTKKEVLEYITSLIKEKKLDELCKLISASQTMKLDTMIPDELFDKFLSLIKQAQNLNLQPFLDCKSFTLSQLSKILKELSTTTIIDKNEIMHSYINKKYEERLFKLRKDTKAQRDVLIEIYKEIKQHSGFDNYLSSLLVQILELGKEIDKYDYELFIDYLNNPMKSKSYDCPAFLSNEIMENNVNVYNVNQISVDYEIFASNTIVDDYLKYFFMNKKATQNNFDKYLSREYLDREYFKACILRGDNVQYNPSLHSNIISKDNYEQLIKKAEITVCSHNKQIFSVDEDVKIDLDVKNVNSMSMSIYEINTENYYLNKKKPITSLIVVEGLITAAEYTYSFCEKSQKIVRRSFTLDKIPKRRGVFLVEIVGNGISTRLIIKKGSLSLVSRYTSKGRMCYIINEKNEICKGKDTSIWYNETKYNSIPDKGTILIPYDGCSDDSWCVLNHDGFSDFANIKVEKPVYSLKGKFYINHESVITGNLARVIFKPILLVNGRAISLSHLKDGKISVNIEKQENNTVIPVKSIIENIEFKENKDIEFEVQIPPKIISLQFVYKAEIINELTHQKEQLTIMQNEKFNTVKNKIFTSYFRKVNEKNKENYVVELVGLNGEKAAKKVMKISITHKENANIFLSFTMQTDDKGKIYLGELNDFGKVSASILNDSDYFSFDLEENSQFSYPESIDAVSGEPLTIPYYTKDKNNKNVKLTRHLNKNVIETIKIDKYVKFNPLKILDKSDCYYELKITNLPIGSYILQLNDKETINIEIHEGSKWIDDNYIISSSNKLIENSQLRSPIYMKDLSIDNKAHKIKISASSLSSHVRAHVYMYNYLPIKFQNFFNNIHNLLYEGVKMRNEQNFQEWKNIYLSNRVMSEEIQYVLDRKNYEVSMGNSLEMPSLLLKREFAKETVIDDEVLDKGKQYEKKDANKQDDVKKNIGQKKRDNQSAPLLSDFQNFLKVPALVLANYTANEKNEIEIDFSKYNNNSYSHIHIILLDDRSVSSHLFTMQNKDYEVQTRSMTNDEILDSSKLLTEIRKTENKFSGNPFILSENSDYKLIDSVEKVLNFFIVKYPQFKTDWKGKDFLLTADKDDEKKFLENYSNLISHEINVFIYFKYPGLFETIVKPIIKYKFEKSFIDYFLLDDIDTLRLYFKSEKLMQLSLFELCLLIIKFISIDIEAAKKIRNLIKAKLNLDKSESILGKNFDIMMSMQNKGTTIEAKEDQKEEKGINPEHLNASYVCRDFEGSFASRSGYEEEVPRAPQMLNDNVDVVRHLDECFAMEKECLPEIDSGSLMDQVEFKDFKYTNQVQAQVQQNQLFDESCDTMSEGIIDNKNQDGSLGAKEYIERHYLHEAFESHLISPIWLDLADYLITNKTIKGFLSKYILYDIQNIVELIWVLSVIDLPISTQKHEYSRVEGRKIKTVPASNIFLLSKEIAEGNPLLNNKLFISQNVWDYKTRENADLSNLEAHVIYGHETIVTNVSNSNLTFDIFVQIPQGSIPMLQSYYTQRTTITVSSYSTSSFPTYFYFPQPGSFKQYHPIATIDNDVICVGTSLEYIVKDKISYLTTKDTDSDEGKKKLYNPMLFKEIISKGESKEILNYFRNESFIESDFSTIRWLLKDKNFYSELISILKEKGYYSYTVYSFSFYHYDEETIKHYLAITGKYSLINLVPDISHIDNARFYPHFEFNPLINARFHSLGKRETYIQNEEFERTYQKFILHCLTLPSLDFRDLLRLTYYLILQDRISEATQVFNRIKKSEISSSNYEIQYDYMNAYLDISNGYPKFEIAKSICHKYKKIPLLYWRNKFEDIEDQLIEYEGKDVVSFLDIGKDDEIEEEVTDSQIKKDLKRNRPTMTFTIEKRNIVIVHSNIDEINIKFYLIDLEIIFSICPSLKSSTNDFSFVKPNFTHKINISNPTGETITTFEIPEDYAKKNIFVEVSAGSLKKFENFFSANLKVLINENVGELRVFDSKLKPVLRAYVKCFASIQGKNVFYKDGYTDLRGQFNYLQLNTDQLQQAEKFFIFVGDDDNGSVVKEVKAPSYTDGDKSYDGYIKYKKKQKEQWRLMNKK